MIFRLVQKCPPRGHFLLRDLSFVNSLDTLLGKE